MNTVNQYEPPYQRKTMLGPFRALTRPSQGFTLVELAIVLIVIGILVGLGTALLGPLTKQAAFKRTRERVKACKEAVIGFVAASRRLPTQSEFTTLCNERDAWGIALVYLPDDTSVRYDGTNDRANLTSGTVCCAALPSDMAVNDRAATGGTDNYRKNVAFIVLSKGEDRTQNGSLTDNTDTGGGEIYSVYNIEEYSDTYDDIIEYVTVYELKDTIRCEPLQMTTVNLPDATEDTSYNATLSATGGCPPYTWSASNCQGTTSTLPTGLSLSGSALTGTLNLFSGPSGTLNGCSTTTSNFTLSVQDSQGGCVDNTFSITVRPQSLRINTDTLPDGTVSVPYSANIIGAGGNISAYNYTVTGLPSGLSATSSSDCDSDTYNECSQISGTPSGNCGDYSVTAQLNDGCTITSKNYNIHLYKLISCSLTATDNGDGTWDIAYSITNGPVNGVFSPQSGTCTSFSNSTGGTCTTASLTNDTTFTLTIADNCGDMAKCQTTILLAGSSSGSCSTPMSLSPASGTTFNATVGTAFSANVSVSGGLSPYTNTTCTTNCNTYGLSLNCTSSSATLSGTPTSAGTCTFTVAWQDSCTPANSVSGTYNVNIASSTSCTPFSGWSSSLPTATNCQSYSGSVTVFGGVPNYTWTVNPSPIMNGLTDCNGQITTSNSCSISGTPLADPDNSPYSFTVTVTDSCSSGAQTTTQSFSIDLDPDSCYSGGIRVRNSTGQDRCYSVGGTAYVWRRNRDITINPGDSVEVGFILSNFCIIQCTTDYCEQKNLDVDNDCRTQMSTLCNFTDR